MSSTCSLVGILWIGSSPFLIFTISGLFVLFFLCLLFLPLLFFLLLSGGSPDAFFAHVANLGDRFLAADLARRVTFLGQCKFVLIGLATLVVVWRMPRFIRHLDRELSGEKL